MAKTTAPKAETPPKPVRGKLDPTDKPLWRMKRGERRELLEPFVGKRIKVERWFGRVAAKGDRTYTGELVSVATTTTGSTSDFLILRMVDGIDWAISTAQVAYLELVTPPAKPTKTVRRAPKKAPAAA